MIRNRAAAAEANSPEYLGWRSALLAEAAFARLPSLDVHPVQHDDYDFIVATKKGICCFVVVRAFSSFRTRWRVDAAEWKWTIDADLVCRARQSPTPYILFVFDADTDHGRFARLDLLSEPSADARSITIALPASQTIDEDTLSQLIAELESTALAPRSA